MPADGPFGDAARAEVNLVGRLRPGVTVAQATAEIGALSRRLDGDLPGDTPRGGPGAGDCRRERRQPAADARRGAAQRAGAACRAGRGARAHRATGAGGKPGAGGDGRRGRRRPRVVEPARADRAGAGRGAARRGDSRRRRGAAVLGRDRVPDRAGRGSGARAVIGTRRSGRRAQRRSGVVRCSRRSASTPCWPRTCGSALGRSRCASRWARRRAGWGEWWWPKPCGSRALARRSGWWPRRSLAASFVECCSRWTRWIRRRQPQRRCCWSSPRRWPLIFPCGARHGLMRPRCCGRSDGRLSADRRGRTPNVHGTPTMQSGTFSPI